VAAAGTRRRDAARAGRGVPGRALAAARPRRLPVGDGAQARACPPARAAPGQRARARAGDDLSAAAAAGLQARLHARARPVDAGGVHDDKTLLAQVAKLRSRFGLRTVVLVVDRGMVTKANLDALAAQEGIAWISALKAPQLKKLVKDGSLQLSLCDELNLAE